MPKCSIYQSTAIDLDGKFAATKKYPTGEPEPPFPVYNGLNGPLIR